MTTNKTIKAATKAEFKKGKILFKEYAKSLNFDLGYQNFKSELQTMELQYKSP